MGIKTLDEILGGSEDSGAIKESTAIKNRSKSVPKTLTDIHMEQTYLPKQELNVPTISEGSPLGITEEQRIAFGNQGKIGFFEGFFRSEGLNDIRRFGREAFTTMDPEPGDDFSFFNSIEVNSALGRFFGEDGYDYTKYQHEGKLVDRGEEHAKHLRDKDIAEINAYLYKFAEEQIRGAHTRGKIGSGVGELPLLMLEFLGSGSIATGIKAGLKKKVGGLVKEGIETATKQSLKKKIATGTALIPKKQ